MSKRIGWYVCDKCFEAIDESDLERIVNSENLYVFECPKCSNKSFMIYASRNNQ